MTILFEDAAIITTSFSNDVTKANKRSILFVTTDITANNESDIHSDNAEDGSIRIVFTPGDEFAHIEKKSGSGSSGVWNDTGFRASAGSLEVGRDLKIEAAADFIKTNNPSGFDLHSTALIPHIPFNGSGTGLPHTPITDIPADVVIFSTAVSEVSGILISQSFPISSAQIIDTISYEVGTVGATDAVRHTLYKGTDNTGDIISRMNLPASDFVAETTTMIEFGSAFGFSEMHVDIFVEFMSDTAFTLKTDVDDNILITLSSQQLETRVLWHDGLMLNEGLGLMFDEDLNPLYSIQFP